MEQNIQFLFTTGLCTVIFEVFILSHLQSLCTVKRNFCASNVDTVGWRPSSGQGCERIALSTVTQALLSCSVCIWCSSKAFSIQHRFHSWVLPFELFFRICRLYAKPISSWITCSGQQEQRRAVLSIGQLVISLKLYVPPWFYPTSHTVFAGNVVESIWSQKRMSYYDTL